MKEKQEELKTGSLVPLINKAKQGQFRDEEPQKKMRTAIEYPIMYKVIQRSGLGRAAQMTLPHGLVNTPVYMPVGTKGAMKALLPEDMNRLGC